MRLAMRLQALLTLTIVLALPSCSTTVSSELPYSKPNSLMSEEISRRVGEIEFQHRGELLDNLLWLAQTGEQAIPDLLAGLGNPSPKVRANCAWVLGRVGDRRTIPDLQRKVRDDSEVVRLEVARSLVLMGDMQPATVLIEGLDSERTEVRYNCNEALKMASGRDFGFDHLAENPVDRQMASLRWRQWWGEMRHDPFFASSYARAHGLDTQAEGAMGQPAAPMGETQPMPQDDGQPQQQQPKQPQPKPQMQPMQLPKAESGEPRAPGDGSDDR